MIDKDITAMLGGAFLVALGVLGFLFLPESVLPPQAQEEFDSRWQGIYEPAVVAKAPTARRIAEAFGR
jgi:hypothetical protein